MRFVIVLFFEILLIDFFLPQSSQEEGGVSMVK